MKNSSDKKIKYLRNLLSRTLISIILVISVCILIKIDDKNLLLVEDYVFTDSLKFTKINNWYQKNIGKMIPEVKNNELMVFSSEELKSKKYEIYGNGVKINVDPNSPVSILNGGIVVFIGKKDNYGNTVIIQGNDGIDYWYGNITNVNVNLYDYIEKDTLIGETLEDYLFLVLQKDGKFISYEEYFNQI